jgi:GH35 family endo-1,4-beta-xylanase
VQYAAANPAFRYGSAQLLYGVFLGPNNNEQVPAWLRGPDSSSWYGAPKFSPEQLTQYMRDFIIAYVQRYGTGCQRTEIGNELVSYPQSDFYYMNSSIGRAGGKTVAQYIHQVARWAKAANPNVKLFVNDTRNEDTQTTTGIGNAFGVLVRELKAMGTPIDGLGFQCHQRHDIAYNYDSVEGVFAYLASLGYDLHITEMGISAPVGSNGLVSAADQEKQAAQYRALVGAFLRGAGARAKSITTWGTTDVNAFDRGGLLFDVNGQKKAAFYAVLDALNQ